MQATEEENKRIAAACKTKCTANAVSKAMGEINKASEQVSEYCASQFPCAGELEKVKAEASNIQKQARELSDTTTSSSSSSSSSSTASSSEASSSNQMGIIEQMHAMAAKTSTDPAATAASYAATAK